MVLVDLHSAAASADLARLRQHWWLNKHRINGYNRDKQTPLHLACINGHADVVQFLVENKCNLNPCDKLDKSPLMKAVEYQHRDCAAILLEHGANHGHRGVNGNTALHFAVMVSSKSLVVLLLEHGADIDAKNKWGYTPLTLAIIENREEMVKFLLQKGADVNARDKVYRTPLTVATFSGNKNVIELLLQHGAVFPESDKGLNPCQPFTKMVQDYVVANEKIGSFCHDTSSVILLETPALAESCDMPKEEAAEKKDNGPAAEQSKTKSVHSFRVQPCRGDYKAEGAEKKEDKHTLCNLEADPKGRRKVRASVRLPAATSTRSYARSTAGERGKGVLPAPASVEAEKKDGDSSWGSKHLSTVRDKVINPAQRPAGKRSRAGVRSLAEKRGKGVLQPAGGALKKEDSDSPRDSETDPKGRRKVRASVRLPAATSTRSYARSTAGERGKGVLPAPASVEAEKKDGDSSWGSEKKRLLAGGVLLQTAVEGVCALLQRSAAKTDSEGEGKVSAAVQPPAANRNRSDVRSAAVEHGKGVLKQAWREAKKEDRVLQPAGVEAKQEDNDFPWDSETDSKGQRKVLADVQLPAADQNRMDVSSAVVKHGKAARAEQKEHFMSSSENKLPTLQGEDLQLKVDSSTQTNSEQDKQPLARQKLNKILKKDSLEGAPLGNVRSKIRNKQKLLLEELERCKTRLKDLKEPLNKNEYYADSGKNAQKEKVITILRNMQGILVDSFNSSAATIPQLEERIQWLQMQMARLEATIQQQAKTIEVFEAIQQSLTSDFSVDTSLWHRDFPHAIKNCFGVKCAK